jgi:signal transduction histidine kinase
MAQSADDTGARGRGASDTGRDGTSELEQLRSGLAEARRRAAEAERLMELSERERRWIALEIHDGLAQELAGATMFLEAARAQLDPESAAARTSLEEATRLVRGALAEARRLMEGIRPPILESDGLTAAVEHVVEQHRERHGLPIEVQLQLQSRRLIPTLEMAAFRIVQEGLANAQRHSQAAHVFLEISQQEQQLVIRLEDDGIGFDPQRIPPDRYGVRGIQERAALAGGAAVIDSEPGRGTRIHVTLPLQDRLLTASTEY